MDHIFAEGYIVAQVPFIEFKFVLTISGFLLFHRNFRISLFISMVRDVYVYRMRFW